MANKDQNQGLSPVGKLISANEYEAGSTIYPGDLVKIANDGQCDPCAASEAAIGVALTYASGAGQKVMVADSPDQRFLIQADDATIAAQTNLALNYNITVGTASTLYKRSAMQLDSSTGATDSILPLRALNIGQAVDNAFGSKVDVIVKINNHSLGNKIEGV
jgi:hypothetical protein